MLDMIYTPEEDFLSPQGITYNDLSEFQEPVDTPPHAPGLHINALEAETSESETDDSESETHEHSSEAGDVEIEAGDVEIEAGDVEIEAGDAEIEAGEYSSEAGDVEIELSDSESEQGILYSEMEEDLVYARDESSRRINNNLSYEDSPVQMQFGEEDGLQFPCIYIKSSQEGLEKHKLMALQNIVKAENAETRMPTYLDVNGSVIKLGTIDSKSLKTLFSNKLFSSWGITVKADAETEYEDDMRLAYCSI